MLRLSEDSRSGVEPSAAIEPKVAMTGAKAYSSSIANRQIAP